MRLIDADMLGYLTNCVEILGEKEIVIFKTALDDARTVSCDECEHLAEPREGHPWVYVGDGVYTTDPREYTEPCGHCYCGSKFKWQP